MSMYIGLTPKTVETLRQLLHHNGHEGGQPAGSFTASLFETWLKADSVNAAKLSQAFPDEGIAIELYRGHYAADVRKIISIWVSYRISQDLSIQAEQN